MWPRRRKDLASIFPVVPSALNGKLAVCGHFEPHNAVPVEKQLSCSPMHPRNVAISERGHGSQKSHPKRQQPVPSSSQT